MSRHFYIYSTLPFKDLELLDQRYNRVLDAYLEEHPAEQDSCDCGESFAAGAAPQSAEFSEDPQIVACLKKCQSCLTIDYPGFEDDALGMIAPALVFLLENAGQTVVSLEDDPELGEVALARLSKRKRANLLTNYEKKLNKALAKKPIKKHVAKEGEVEIIHLAQNIQAMVEDPELRIDAESYLKSLSPEGQSIFVFLAEEEFKSIPDMQKRCKLAKPDFQKALQEVMEVLDEE